MKIGITTLIATLFVLNTVAQTAKDAKAAKQLFESVDTYKYSVLSNKFLSDEKMRYLYGYNKVTGFESKLVKTGRKDVQGNEILEIELYQDDRLVGKVLPDFEDCSLFAQFSYYGLNNDKDTVLYNKLVTLLPIEEELFCRVSPGSTEDGSGILAAKASTPKAFYELTNQFKHGFYLNGYLYVLALPGAGEFTEAVKARWLQDHKDMWEAAWNRSESILANMTKSYDELMKEALPEGSCILYTNSDYRTKHVDNDRLRISYTKDDAGNIQEIKFQFPFKDGKYYDKEQFYAKAVKDQTGKFKVENNNSTIPITHGLYLIPFEGSILFTKLTSGDSHTYQAVSATEFNSELRNIIGHGHFFSTDDTDELEKECKEWVELKTFEMEYDWTKDLLLFGVFFKQYVEKLK